MPVRLPATVLATRARVLGHLSIMGPSAALDRRGGAVVISATGAPQGLVSAWQRLDRCVIGPGRCQGVEPEWDPHVRWAKNLPSPSKGLSKADGFRESGRRPRLD